MGLGRAIVFAIGLAMRAWKATLVQRSDAFGFASSDAADSVLPAIETESGRRAGTLAENALARCRARVAVDGELMIGRVDDDT
jgi:hypothetical protein